MNLGPKVGQFLSPFSLFFLLLLLLFSAVHTCIEAQVQLRALESAVAFIYTVSRKKDQNVFCSIFYKTQAILVKFSAPLPE